MGLFGRFFKKEDKEDHSQVPPKVLPMRNDLCWCDSGLKYKKCHLEQDQLYLEKQYQKELAAKKSCSPVFG
ncbi:MAG: SEC-C domain-containing protein [Desulfuromusa sp.]|jgi:uncharacterized protein YecA (UPF0149 family)|nr:SEC-C domain-containing protein [Desulfuromusa sp.]